MPCPGVITVITGKEVAAHTRSSGPVQANFTAKGWTWRLADVYAIPADKVRWHGEPVAAVVAEDEETARLAADLVAVDLSDTLPVAGDVLTALEPGAPKVYDDWEDNKQVHLVFDFGDPDKAFEMADQVLPVTNREGRVTGLPIEPRGVLGVYDTKNDTLEMWDRFRPRFCPGTTLPPPWECLRPR
ncbi:MAG: molybdopterin cofactor-binding domain-containing protein [Desulfotignum sp.]|nr:molybdopterin cofactor-binding domain-containing protein [Desulfotignum sp.]